MEILHIQTLHLFLVVEGVVAVELVDRSGGTGKRDLTADAALEELVQLLGLQGASP